MLHDDVSSTSCVDEAILKTNYMDQNHKVEWPSWMGDTWFQFRAFMYSVAVFPLLVELVSMYIYNINVRKLLMV